MFPSPMRIPASPLLAQRKHVTAYPSSDNIPAVPQQGGSDALPFPQLYRKRQLRMGSHPQHFLETHLPQPEKSKLSENKAVQSTDQTRAGREL